MRTAALLTLLLAAALSFGACGGGAEREATKTYVLEVNTAQSDFARTVTTVSKRITPKSTSSQDRRTLQRFQRAIEEVVGKLRRIAVPGTVQVEHQQLVRAMSGFGTDIRKATLALRNPDSRAIAGAQRTIARATETVNVRIDNAIAAINSKLTAK